MSDLDQRRRTVRVLSLLSESVEAYASGDAAGSDRLIREAAEADVMAHVRHPGRHPHRGDPAP